MWEKLLLIFAGLTAMFLLLSIALNIVPGFENKNIEGNKQFVIQQLLKKCYECYQKHYPKRESIICDELTFKTNEEIYAQDFLDNLDTSKIPEESFEAEDIGLEGKIVIRYENSKIYMMKV